MWNNKNTYQDPKDWFKPNTFVDIGASISCFKASPHWGIYAIGVCPFKVPNFDTLSGFALQKFQYTQMAKSVSLFYHYPSKKNDSASLVVLFFKGYSGDTNNIIGTTTVYLTKQNNWIYRNADIVWKNNLTPDSATIGILNNIKNKIYTLFVDDISLSLFGTSVAQSNIQKSNVFVSSDNQLVLNNEYNNNCEITLVNSLGQIVLTHV